MFTDRIDWMRTENPDVKFENNELGRVKKEVWDMNEEQLEDVYKRQVLAQLVSAHVSIFVSGRYCLSKRRRHGQIDEREIASIFLFCLVKIFLAVPIKQ